MSCLDNLFPSFFAIYWPFYFLGLLVLPSPPFCINWTFNLSPFNYAIQASSSSSLTFAQLFLSSSSVCPQIEVTRIFTASVVFFLIIHVVAYSSGMSYPDARIGDYLFFICLLSYKTDDCLSIARSNQVLL